MYRHFDGIEQCHANDGYDKSRISAKHEIIPSTESAIFFRFGVSPVPSQQQGQDSSLRSE
jgi:hypothetical protein